jgi:hypothetical protein
MNAAARRSACLAASLAVAWNAAPETAKADVPAEQSTVYTRVSWFHSLAMARFVTFTDGTPDFIYEMGQIPSGNAFRSLPIGSGFNGYAFVGVGMGSGGSGSSGEVMLSFSDPTYGVGHSFESLFPNIPEAQAADAILTGGQSLTTFVADLAHVPGAITSMAATSSGVKFTDGVFAGTSEASFSPVPEPGSAIVCLGALGFGFLLRRKPALAVTSASTDE